MLQILRRAAALGYIKGAAHRNICSAIFVTQINHKGAAHRNICRNVCDVTKPTTKVQRTVIFVDVIFAKPFV